MQAEQQMTGAQRGAIYAISGKAGLSSDALHDVVRKLTGLDSIAALSSRQAIRVIDSLKRTAGQVDPLGWTTKAQRGKIYAVCRNLGWVTPENAVDMKRLEGFVAARFGVAKLAWVQADKAGKIIEALKAMEKGGRGERKQKEATP